MTTRRGEAIESERESVADILRPLVEAKVEDVRPDEVPFPRSVLIPDPRFDALRRWEYYPPPLPSGWTLDASLGAIVRAAASFGLDVVELYQWPGGDWGCSLRHYLSTLPNDPKRPHGSGATPEEAAARALVAAWRREQGGR